ncbi:MAG: hypothetical protein GF311_22155 [Candidatus Lokiarchaeota archaeon]|nr:hypothetical protein [Candidatus Lokiarchaeota archaeon]
MDITKKGYYFLGLIISLFLWVIILYLLGPPSEDIFDIFIRLGVLIGYTSMFVAALIIPFMKEVTKMFGTSFLKIHHILSLIGIILITAHPIAMAINWETLSVFLPEFSDWFTFWQNSGRIAFYIIYFAAIIGLVRKYITPKIWRFLHAFIYIALVFGYFHGLFSGTDFQENFGVMITFTAMLVLTFEVLIYRRYQKYKLKQRT